LNQEFPAVTDKPALSLAVWRYDRTQALYDGRVGLSDREIRLIDAPLEEIFSRAFATAEFDVTELSFSNFLRLTLAGNCRYVGLPVFPSRSFRHGAFYVRDDASINSPADLVGRRVGVREYSMTAALAARGALRDQFGIGSEAILWVTGDVDEKERDVIPLPTLHRPVNIEVAPDGALLSDMLLDGRLDAILAYKPIRPFKEGKGARRLFADHAAVEETYFRETGIFPIMHLIGIRDDVLEREPGLARQVIDVFAAAQAIAEADLHTEQALKIGLPWVGRELARTIEVMGENFWPKGFAANRKVIERMIDWSFADGLIARKPAPEDLFPATL
jgi:4,5-dihydroxyphthalate decarboxylase